MSAQALARSFCSLVGIALLAAAGPLASPALARDFEIRHHERLQTVRHTAERISFVAYGRQFDLRLESNAGIVATQSSGGLHDTTLLRGTLADTPGSWVRLGESRGRFTGAIWDGSELWLIDTVSHVADYLLQPEPTGDADSVIFRLSEVSGALGDVVSDVVDAPAGRAAASAAAAVPATALASFGPQPGRVLDIGLVATGDFAALHGEQAHDVLLQMFNIVEGIFITQVGVQLRAVEVAVLESTPPELEDANPQTLLENFSTWKVRTPELSPLGLAHLFVSRDLDDLDPPVRTVGIANLGVLCDRGFGVGITQATHATIIDALIAAHELGHNFGAPHDAEAGSLCATEPDSFIMAPKISGSTRFSQCSIEQMQPEILSAGCMREIPPTDLQLTIASPPPAQINERESLEFEVVLSNLSNSNVAGLELHAASASLAGLNVNLDAIADGYCEGSSGMRCVWPWFPAGASVVLRLGATAQTPGMASIDVAVDSLHELDASDNALQFDIEVLPLAELLSLMTPGSASLRPGESTRFEAAVSNRGNLEATGVVAHISIDNGLELSDMELPGCTASHEPERVVHACPIGTLPARQSWSFGFSVRVPADFDVSSIAEDPTANVGVLATSDSVSLSDADRSAQATVTIGETIADLSVTIDGPNLIEIGEEAVWEITVANLGPDAAESVRVFDTDASRALPSDAVRIEAIHGDCALAGANTEFDCTLPALAVGEQTTIRLTAVPAQAGQYFWIEAAAESAAPDGDRSNDQTSLLVAANDGVLAAAPDTTTAGAETADSGDGGGGSTGALSLLSLLALLRLRRRYRR